MQIVCSSNKRPPLRHPLPSFELARLNFNYHACESPVYACVPPYDFPTYERREGGREDSTILFRSNDDVSRPVTVRAELTRATTGETVAARHVARSNEIFQIQIVLCSYVKRDVKWNGVLRILLSSLIILTNGFVNTLQSRNVAPMLLFIASLSSCDYREKLVNNFFDPRINDGDQFRKISTE